MTNTTLVSLLAFLATPLAFSQAVGQQTRLSGRLQQASLVFQKLVTTHPEPEINTVLNKWITEKKVMMSFQSDYMPGEMAAELVDVKGKMVVVLVMNPNFVLGSTNFNLSEDLKYKQLVVYHEYTHMANHFNGKARLSPSVFDKKKIPEMSKNKWDSEFLATAAEWRLAKKMHWEHLMPTVSAAVKKQGEQRGFLDGFYKAFKASPNVSSPELFLPHWEKIYQQEKARLDAKK